MRRVYLFIPVLLVLLLAVACGGPKAIPVAAITEIRTLDKTQPVSNYGQIMQVDDRAGSAYIMFYIRPSAGEFTSLEDALIQVRTFDQDFLRNVVDILKKHGINGNVSVWFQLPMEQGGVTILGHSSYEGKNFRDFVRYTS